MTCALSRRRTLQLREPQRQVAEMEGLRQVQRAAQLPELQKQDCPDGGVAE